ncbi:uncharacterized protein DEA37_0011656 [Paragonimus westermani]|uniref:Uncharacterized protein n=1 Tax=Paragonimus westermani TaxID=34504 RepID=A0A5J4NVV7_9TREM|nr:uncharacterized protein DEA37_0011656 [Paragonimus westermani]
MPVETLVTSMPGPSLNGNSVPRPSRLLGHHERVSGTNQSPMIYTRYNHTPHSTYGPTCPLHQHSGRASNSHSTTLINATDGNHLTASGAVLSVATVPSLQPASRFRKARIHETVEQWSCGRASIHDCRLRTVPGWVSELQKKSCLLERDVTTAMAQKVNCLSCLEMRTHDQNQAGCQHLLNLPPVVNACSLTEPSGHPHHPQSKADPSNVKTTSLSGKLLTNNLFLFWDDGCRVTRQLPKLSHCKGINDNSMADLTRQEVDLCPLCACSMVNTTELPGELCQPKLINASHNPETVRQIDRVTLESQCELQSGKRISRMTVLTADGTLVENASSKALPNAADPATAYLRRYQVDSMDPITASLSVPAESQTKCGDSPSVDEFSTTTLSTPDSADFPNHLPSSYSTLSKHNSTGVNRISSLHPHGGHVRTKKIVKVLPSGAVPPTSPNLFEVVQAGRLTESSSIGFPGDSNVFNGEAHSLRNTLDIYPEEEEDENISHAQRRFASSSYHNCNQMVHAEPNESDAFTKTLSSAPSPSVPFRSALTDPQKAPTNDRLSTENSLKNGPISGYHCSPTRLLPMKVGREHGGKATSQSKQTRLSPASIDSKLFKEHIQSRKRFADFSGTLETRITGSMNAIRTAIERAFRDELTTVHSENVMLLSEIERLTAEVTVLRGYQSAFFALRSFVAPELWERFCNEFFQSSAPPVGTHPVESTSVLQTFQPDSPQHPDR